MAYNFELGRYDPTVLKLAGGVTSPAVGSSLAAYFKSVLVSQAGTTTVTALGGTATLTVFTTAPLAVNDVVFVNTATTIPLTVTALPSPTSVTLQNNGGSDVAITQYSRLLISSRRPTVWRDERGTTSLGSSFGPTDSNGYAVCYASQRSLDFIASGGDLATPQLIPDQHAFGGGEVFNPEDFGIRFDTGGQSWDGLMNYLAQWATNGAIVQCPPGTWLGSTKIVVPTGVLIRGAGLATTIGGGPPADALFEFAAGSSGLENLTITKLAGGAAPVARILAAASGVSLRQLKVSQGGTGIQVLGATDALIQDILVAGSNFSRLLTISDDGGSNVARNTVVRNIRGSHTVPAGTLTQAILVERGAVNTIIDGFSFGSSNPATQGGTILLVQGGGGADPEGVTMRGGRVGAGYGATAVSLLAGLVNIEDVTVVDSAIGFLVGSCLEASLARCHGIGMRQQTFNIAAGTGIVRIIDPSSSDCSQAGDNTYDHINIAAGREDVHISGRGILGNHIRKTVGTWARDGVHIETGGAAITRFSCHGVDGYYGAQRGIRGDLLAIPESVLDQGSGAIDISHNGDVRDAAGGLLFPSGKTIDHVGAAGRTITITAGAVLPIRNIDSVILDGNTLAITSATGGYDGQLVTVYNKNATAATLADSASIQVTGAGSLSLAQDTLVLMKWLNGKLRQAAAAAGP